MTDNLETAILDLWNIDPALTPVPYAYAREKAIVAGLQALAATYGKEIEFTHIDARGELAFNLKGSAQGRGGEYGEELAAVLSLVPRRTGVSPTSSPVLAQNNWCSIGHFDAEKMLKLFGAEFYGIGAPDMSAEAGDEDDESFQMRP
jgi:hypothetical protein